MFAPLFYVSSHHSITHNHTTTLTCYQSQNLILALKFCLSSVKAISHYI